MNAQRGVADVDYPESDGKPMGETDLHRDWMFRIIELMRYRYRGQRVYVSGDLLVYYEEGNPKKFIVPDGFVVKNSDPGRRRIYKLWEEGVPPHVVFETTSRKTKRKDTVIKPELYARIGVPEYFVYDPTSDYLDPPLRGFRLTARGYEPIEPDAAGALHCEQLGIDLFLEDGDLIMQDSATGERLQTAAEANQAAREAEQIAREAERIARAAAAAERAAREAAEAERNAERAAREAAEAREDSMRKALEQWQARLGNVLGRMPPQDPPS